MEDKIELSDVIDQIREQLADATLAAKNKDIQFFVEGVELELQVGVTKSAEGKGGLRFWVFEVGGGASIEGQSVQTVRVKLGKPITRDGDYVPVSSPEPYK